MAQRGLVVYAQAALERADVTVHKAKQREAEAIEKHLFHLQAQRCPRPEVAHDALTALAQRWRYHRVESYHLREHTRYAGKGRPTPHTPLQVSEWQLQAQVRPDAETIGHHQQVKAGFVLGTNIGTRELCDTEVIAAYKGQSRGAGGLRCLTDPLFFVSSLFVKKPSRIEGLLMVMTLAWLVYSVAQRRLRQQ